MIWLKVLFFLFGIVLIWAGLPTLGGGMVFAVAINEFCKEFGTRGRRY